MKINRRIAEEALGFERQSYSVVRPGGSYSVRVVPLSAPLSYTVEHRLTCSDGETLVRFDEEPVGDLSLAVQLAIEALESSDLPEDLLVLGFALPEEVAS